MYFTDAIMHPKSTVYMYVLFLHSTLISSLQVKNTLHAYFYLHWIYLFLNFWFPVPIK